MGLRQRLIEQLGNDEPDADAPCAVGPVELAQSGIVSVALHDAGIRHLVAPALGVRGGDILMYVDREDLARASEIVWSVIFRPGSGRR
jgi:hypothetical protein